MYSTKLVLYAEMPLSIYYRAAYTSAVHQSFLKAASVAKMNPGVLNPPCGIPKLPPGVSRSFFSCAPPVEAPGSVERKQGKGRVRDAPSWQIQHFAQIRGLVFVSTESRRTR